MLQFHPVLQTIPKQTKKLTYIINIRDNLNSTQYNLISNRFLHFILIIHTYLSFLLPSYLFEYSSEYCQETNKPGPKVNIYPDIKPLSTDQKVYTRDRSFKFIKNHQKSDISRHFKLLLKIANSLYKLHKFVKHG